MFNASLTKDEKFNAHVLELSGIFTLDEKRRVDRLVMDAVCNDCAGLVIDFTKLTYIDSAGLMSVLGAFHKFSATDRPVVLATGRNTYVQDKLAEIGLGRGSAIQVVDSVEVAKRALSPSARDGDSGDD